MQNSTSSESAKNPDNSHHSTPDSLLNLQSKPQLDKNLRLLGMAKKAGLLAVGAEAVKLAARAGKARIIISAYDASEATKRRAYHSSKVSGAAYVSVPYTSFELGNVTGRGSPGTVAILDKGLALGFAKGLIAINSEVYNEISGFLEKETKKSIVKKGKYERRAEL